MTQRIFRLMKSFGYNVSMIINKNNIFIMYDDMFLFSFFVFYFSFSIGTGVPVKIDDLCRCGCRMITGI